MAESDPPPNVSLQTILEQQRVIAVLREMVSELKSRVAQLESAQLNPPQPNPPQSDPPQSHSAESDPALLESALVESRRLRAELDAAAAQCAGLAEAAERHAAAHEAAALRLRALSRADGECREARAALELAKQRCGEAERRARRLEEEADAVAIDRVRWRALATSLAARADNVAKQRAQLYIEALDRDERMRTESARAASLHTYPHPNVSPRSKCVGGESEAARTAIMDPWTLGSPHRPHLPPVTQESDVPLFKRRGRGRAQRGNRFLVPL